MSQTQYSNLVYMEQIDRIIRLMNESGNTQHAILKAANVELPDDLTGVNAEAWNNERNIQTTLYGYLMRIDSILDSANKFIFANLS